MIFLLTVISHAEEGYREFTNTKGQTLMAKVIRKDAQNVVLEREKDSKSFTLKITTLSEDDQDYIEDLILEENSTGELHDDEPITGALKRFYPKAKDEIAAGIAEIRERERPSEISEEDFAAVCELNIYRFLSGVPADVKSNSKLNSQAKDAARACLENKGLSHKLGRWTEKCNLALGPGGVQGSVKLYMEDSGSNNQAERGHRRWCLNPSMGKSGFGSEQRYSAMWALDTSGGTKMKFWGYPGEGFYPKEYLHDTSWSAYFDKNIPAAGDLEIRILKLTERPTKLPVKIDEVAGQEVPVIYKNSFKNSLNFEVEYPDGKAGIYWVEIKGRKLKQRYLVELF